MPARAGGAEAPQAPELPGGVPDDELAPQGPLGPLAGGASRVLGSPHPEALLLIAQTQVRILRDYHTRNAQTASLTHMSASAPQQADGTPAGKVLQVMRQGWRRERTWARWTHWGQSRCSRACRQQP